jgi:hypothetical protein
MTASAIAALSRTDSRKSSEETRRSSDFVDHGGDVARLRVEIEAAETSSREWATSRPLMNSRTVPDTMK